MSCKLCCESNENSLDLTSDEGIQQNALKILQKYFPFCFVLEGDDGLVCRKCWCKVEIFHSFYLHIESRHSSLQDRSQIYVSSINDFESVNDEKEGVSEIIVNECSSALDVDWNHDSYDDVKVETLPKRKVKANEKKFANRLIKTNAIEKTRSASNKIFKCDSCSLLFLSRSKLYAHIKNEHLALQFKCSTPRCCESFATQTQLEEHVKKMHEKSQCPHCSKMLLKHRLSLHIQNYHNEDKRIMCDLCGKMKMNRSSYMEHIQNVHETHEKLQCDICKAWLLNKSTLRIHINRRHVQTSQKCQICGKISPNKNALRNHVKTHSAEARQKFKCNICGKGCRDKYNLTDHMNVHSDVKKYVCSFCDIAYRTVKSLQKHIKKEHSGLEQN